jgi:NitT/TauT family transport system substrate-binding protein
MGGVSFAVRVAGLGAAALVLGLSACRRAQPSARVPGPRVDPAALTPLRFQTDWSPQPEQGGNYQAEARGFYREAGLTVTILPGGPGHPVLTGLLAGQAEVEIAQSVDAIIRVGAGLPLVMIGAVMEHDPLAVMVHAGSPVRGLADLNGRTVMALPGTTWLGYVKARYHIDFKLIPMNFSLAQFMADPELVQQCFITSEPYFVGLQGGRTRTFLIADSGFDPYRVYVTTRRVLRERPAALRAFLAASIRGWDDFTAGDPGPGEERIARLNPQMTRPFMAYSVAAMVRYGLVAGDPRRGESTGLLTARRLREQIELLLRLRLLAAPLSVDQVASFAVLPAALQAAAVR